MHCSRRSCVDFAPHCCHRVRARCAAASFFDASTRLPAAAPVQALSAAPGPRQARQCNRSSSRSTRGRRTSGKPREEAGTCTSAQLARGGRCLAGAGGARTVGSPGTGPRRPCTQGVKIRARGTFHIAVYPVGGGHWAWQAQPTPGQGTNARCTWQAHAPPGTSAGLPCRGPSRLDSRGSSLRTPSSTIPVSGRGPRPSWPAVSERGVTLRQKKPI
jgi:hypothetical protein